MAVGKNKRTHVVAQINDLGCCPRLIGLDQVQRSACSGLGQHP